ncbi:hypothetical protein BJ878DRAFT_485455 [Calycina marina]|uniref:Uncharacterized protein n=1 Tax=Calycina marina TaxID=1763456 RepID=A0A9P8CKZ6_9HELO|nr:hypothetical protein BJ878DRAFT_485455 [Calycina marina]
MSGYVFNRSSQYNCWAPDIPTPFLLFLEPDQPPLWHISSCPSPRLRLRLWSVGSSFFLHFPFLNASVGILLIILLVLVALGVRVNTNKSNDYRILDSVRDFMGLLSCYIAAIAVFILEMGGEPRKSRWRKAEAYKQPYETFWARWRVVSRRDISGMGSELRKSRWLEVEAYKNLRETFWARWRVGGL